MLFKRICYVQSFKVQFSGFLIGQSRITCRSTKRDVQYVAMVAKETTFVDRSTIKPEVKRAKA